eukprot:3211449-Alexandrium_andersonii.AAC.1
MHRAACANAPHAKQVAGCATPLRMYEASPQSVARHPSHRSKVQAQCIAPRSAGHHTPGQASTCARARTTTAQHE